MKNEILTEIIKKDLLGMPLTEEEQKLWDSKSLIDNASEAAKIAELAKEDIQKYEDLRDYSGLYVASQEKIRLATLIKKDLCDEPLTDEEIEYFNNIPLEKKALTASNIVNLDAESLKIYVELNNYSGLYVACKNIMDTILLEEKKSTRK